MNNRFVLSRDIPGMMPDDSASHRAFIMLCTLLLVPPPHKIACEGTFVCLFVLTTPIHLQESRVTITL